MNPFLIFLGLLFLHTSGAAVDSSAARYGWPLAHPPVLTSSFGEYRPGHFHAGVDLSTSGGEGLPVLAVGDGDVVRVRASGVGYGRAVYLRLDDGRLAVYAHLSSMMEPLARYVGAVQDSLGLYRVDLYPEPGRFRVRRGQEVGRSGSSGAGAPHLHFELREGDVAVNPLTHGLVAADVHPPELRAVVFKPLSGSARVNGEAERVRVPLTRGAAGGELAAAREVRIWGKVGVGLDGFDRASDSGDRLGIYRMELYVDGALRFAAHFDRFDYYRNHEVEAEFDYEEALAGRRSVRNLFVPPGIAGPFHDDFQAGSGILDAGASSGKSVLAPGLHRLTLVGIDAAGNRTSALASVRVAGPPVLDGVELIDDPNGGSRVEVDARGCGSKLAAIEVEHGARGGGAFTAWRSAPAGDGKVGIAIGRHELDNPHDVLRVRVVDEAGQRSNRLVVLAHGAHDPPNAAREPAQPQVLLTPGTRMATLEVDFASPPVAPPSITFPGASPIVLDALDARRFVAQIDARGQSPLEIAGTAADGSRIDARVDLPWAPVPRDRSGSHFALDGRVRVDFPANAFFDDGYLWAGIDVKSPVETGVVLEGPWFRVEPRGLPLDRGVWVGFRFDSTAVGLVAAEPGAREASKVEGGLGLYRLDSDGTLSFEGSERRDEGYIGAQVRRLGRFVLARDIEPPTVAWLWPADGSVLKSARPRFRARVRDHGSGFREDDVTFFIDDRRVPTEWDPEADVMIHRPSSPLRPGRHVIAAQATDRAGLTARREIHVTVR